MSSTTINSSSSQTLKTSKIPIPIPNSSGRESVSKEKKPPFERGKSAGELKQRLASAVSAKIAAANKDGRTTPNNNRGIEYLLQRKKQPDSRLNTKAIAFQKPVRNSDGDPVKGDRTEAKNGGNLKGPSDLSKPVLQKSLLNALMSSRKPYGIPQGKPATVESRVDATSANRNSTVSTVAGRSLASGNKPSNIGKAFAGGSTRNGAENNSRITPSSLQGIKPELSVDGARKLTLNENGENKASSSVREKTVVKLKDPIIKPKLKGKVNETKSVGTPDVKQMAEKKIFPEKRVSPNKQLFSGTENRGSLTRTNAKPTVAPKPNSHLRSKIASGKGLIVPKKQDNFREDLLEMLEANVGSCKIAAFQAMEDFSVLRMRVYRIRGDLERLKREREKRTPL